VTRFARWGSNTRAVLGALLLAGGLVAFMLAWAGANPPGASPDEDAHVVKAYATGSGQIRGEPYEADLTGLSPLSADYFRQVGRSYLIPQRIVPPDTIRCFAFDREVTADCQRLERRSNGELVLTPTHLGTYLPAVYAPIGLMMQGASDYRSAEWRGRLAVTAVSGLFVVWAALLLSRRGSGWWPLAGLALAVTPTVVFLSASVTTSGVEIVAAVCVWAAALRIARQPDDRAGAPWAALAVSGATMALSRPLAAVLLVVVLGTVGAFVGKKSIRDAITAASNRAVVVGIVLAVATGISALWSFIVIPHPPIDVDLALGAVGDTLRDVPNQVRQVVGLFGWNDTPMPQMVYPVALVLLSMAVVGGLWLARRRERAVVVGLMAVVVALHMGLAIFVEAQIGFGMQARYLLPLVVGLPILAVDILEVRRLRLPLLLDRYGLVVVFVGSALIHLVALTANVHRYAVGGQQGWLPPWDALWVPDGGLGPWFTLAFLATIFVGSVGLLARSDNVEGDEPARSRIRSGSDDSERPATPA
jgi:hypothetical protein